MKRIATRWFRSPSRVNGAGLAGAAQHFSPAVSLRVSLVAAMAMLELVCCGCSNDGLPIVPVRGRVTFNGGPPPAAGTISFTPISTPEGLPRRPGRARFDKSGSFQVTSFSENDGLLPGTYHAAISCWMGMPSSNDPSSFDRLNHVPKDFEPAPIEVNADVEVVEVSIDVPKKG